MSLQFELPPNLTADKLMAKLSSQIDLQPVSRDYSLKTYYDSFDWRLYEKGIVCEFIQSKTASLITLKNLEDDLIIASTELEITQYAGIGTGNAGIIKPLHTGV
jgi:hypothetical protein